MIWYLLLALVVIVGFGCYQSRYLPAFMRKPLKRKLKLAVDEQVTFPIKSFRGTSIEFTDNACDAVKGMEGKRFLVHETPPLPVPWCDVERCECHYKYYEDRRTADNERRRTLKTGERRTCIDEKERRIGQGRRQSDGEDETSE